MTQSASHCSNVNRLRRFAHSVKWHRLAGLPCLGAVQYYHGGKETLMTVKSSISLTDEQHAFARALVEAGRYPSLSAVLQQGVDLLRQRIDAEELETAALREILSRRRKGAFVDTESMDARLTGMIADRRRAHGLPS